MDVLDFGGLYTALQWGGEGWCRHFFRRRFAVDVIVFEVELFLASSSLGSIVYIAGGAIANFQLMTEQHWTLQQEYRSP